VNPSGCLGFDQQMPIAASVTPGSAEKTIVDPKTASSNPDHDQFFDTKAQPPGETPV